MDHRKKVLLIDESSSLRDSRVQLLKGTGYAVDVRDDYVAAESLANEASYDLIVVALHGRAEKAIAYSDRLASAQPKLPILLLTDFGVYVPSGTLSRSVESGSPSKLIEEIANMLEGGVRILELPIRTE